VRAKGKIEMPGSVVRLSATWTAVAVVFGIASALAIVFHHSGRLITDYFVLRQDAMFIPITVMWWSAALLFASSGFRASGVEAQNRSGAFVAASLLASLVFVVGIVGSRTVYESYPLSMDEFWAAFDAKVFQTGRFLAEVPARWRHFVPALQPLWVMPIADNSHWASLYLPMNAALRALCGVLGARDMAGPLWSALSILLTWSIARRLWPEQPDAALVSGVLLATSSQLLVTAMTAYAMPAHLAFNLLWLRLFLEKRSLPQAAAAVVAFVATGLHQLIFHPLFAAPFVVRLWIERRWRLAAFHTFAYAAICVFWMMYWGVMLRAQGLAAGTADGLGAVDFWHRVSDVMKTFDPLGFGLVAENLLRFVTWQNPLAIAMAVAGTIAAVRARDGAALCLAAGVVLTVTVMLVVLPFQGHGWGYRYLHGLLGNVALLAGFAWIHAAAPAEASAGRPWVLLLASVVFVTFIALPIRLLQVHDFIHPYAASYRAIEAAQSQVVVVDPRGLWYGGDLVRNDPFLSAGPKVIEIDKLNVQDVTSLCGHYTVSLFEKSAGARFGIASFRVLPDPHDDQLLNLMGRLHCGQPLPVSAPSTR
jgi:hypothetical protein